MKGRLLHTLKSHFRLATKQNAYSLGRVLFRVISEMTNCHKYIYDGCRFTCNLWDRHCFKSVRHSSSHSCQCLLMFQWRHSSTDLCSLCSLSAIPLMHHLEITFSYAVCLCCFSEKMFVILCWLQWEFTLSFLLLQLALGIYGAQRGTSQLSLCVVQL